MLPNTLTDAICRQFGVDPEQYSAPLASVQTLGASAYITEFPTRVASRTASIEWALSGPVNYAIASVVTFLWRQLTRSPTLNRR